MKICHILFRIKVKLSFMVIGVLQILSNWFLSLQIWMNSYPTASHPLSNLCDPPAGADGHSGEAHVGDLLLHPAPAGTPSQRTPARPYPDTGGIGIQVEHALRHKS